MKTLYWDSINPFTGQPFAWGDPNLRWGSPSYYLEPGDAGFVPYPGMAPPAKKKKPFRRAPKGTASAPNPTPRPHNIMATFRYNVAPNSNGGFTTRPVLDEPVTDATLLDLIATDTGLSKEQVTTVLNKTLDRILECSSGCAYSNGFLGRLRFRPTSGGSQTAPGDFNNADELNAGVALAFTADTLSTWRGTLTLESMGELGKVSPHIASILSQDNGQEDAYKPGTLIELSGHNLRFDKADLSQGVFFRAGAAAEVRATTYGTVTPTSLSVLVPASLSGPLNVRVAAFINGSVRSFSYMDPITQLP